MAIQGDFVALAHPTSGTVTINADRTQMTFDNFSTEFGPVLAVYACTNENGANYVELVPELTELEGDFQFNLPPNVNFNSHQYIVIWCVEFSVSFGYAIVN